MKGIVRKLQTCSVRVSRSILEYGRQTHVVVSFVDLEAAFHSVQHDFLLHLLTDAKIGGVLDNRTRAAYPGDLTLSQNVVIGTFVRSPMRQGIGSGVANITNARSSTCGATQS